MYSVSILVLLEATLLYLKTPQGIFGYRKGTNFSITHYNFREYLSWVARFTKFGSEISHSITCSTALHAVLNGIAWLKSGMVDKF
jgi:lysine/ornithine N-monooxygenase